MDGDGRTPARPRGQAWGTESQRAVLHALAVDVARRARFKVAAIEALRSDGNLEFVAIAGNPEAREQLLGKAAPLSVEKMVRFGTRIDGWVHVPAERVDEETRTWMATYGHTPDLPVPDEPDRWHPEDRLVRLMENEGGELRATLYLDEPLDGMRPTARSIAAADEEVGALYEAIVGIVERELYRDHVVMVTQARTAVRSVSPELELPDFLHRMSEAMVEAMPVDSVDVLLAGVSVPSLEPHLAELEEHMRRVWLRRGHLLMEREQTWGYASDAVPTPRVMAELMDRRGLGSWLLMPIGAGEEYLGTLGLGRAEDGARWVDSEISAAEAVASDLTGVVLGSRLVDQHRRDNDRLRDVNEARRDMVLTLAHELRNPLSVLWTHVEILRQDEVPAPAQESLDAMDRAARRIEDMVEDLMALASITDVDQAPPAHPVALSRLVRDTAEFLSPTATAGGVRLELDVVDGLVVEGDESGLHLLVSNLLSNALKYTGPGGRVAVALAPDEVDGVPGVRLTCEDDGIGIDAAELTQIFTPFYRSSSREARSRPGTGLGLAIIEGVVARHHGSIDVRSVLGAGSTFTAWLPLAPPGDVA